MTAEQPLHAVPGLSEALAGGGYDHCFSTTEHEVGGVLVGEFLDGGPVIRGLVPARHAAEGASDLTFTQESWEDIHATLESKFAGLVIVGWYHTHPGYGLFLSAQDQFIHTNFFQNPDQIAVVIDPLAGEEAVYRWQADELVEHYRRRCAMPEPEGRRPQVLASDVRARQPTASSPASGHRRPGTNAGRRRRQTNPNSQQPILSPGLQRPRGRPDRSRAEMSRGRAAKQTRAIPSLRVQGGNDPLGLRTHSRLELLFYGAVIAVCLAVILWAIALR